MNTWVVTNRLTGEIVYAYTADAPVEWPGMEYAQFNHNKVPETIAEPLPERRGVTKQQFLDLLGPVAVACILTAAKTDVGVEAWVKRLDLTTPDPDGTSVDLNDPRTIAGVNAMEAAMIPAGVVEAGWAQEVLSGHQV